LLAKAGDEKRRGVRAKAGKALFAQTAHLTLENLEEGGAVLTSSKFLKRKVRTVLARLSFLDVFYRRQTAAQLARQGFPCLCPKG
jgi:hypothetical protein